ncbi:hypothetical protein MPTK1_7g09970 [Marchantia polymorpha subsp. ruderalis]|uniref:Uncharacterized protein n=2 Tax=Marchantia polymorpha TaxID=3197 RepID=A0AAF6BXY2_MARPO|nr:hypothetical protein MARPO_0003s0016 [Marchantia polymorpha]BBN16866.1 hypothetical protein Mp_7g09970 [Marchantia polymorpha subsp. ruderalis]|eukprot:PTQ49106.1 hypothetical protein MARPO_0003s0016 [Marchantia polymorpha]
MKLFYITQGRCDFHFLDYQVKGAEIPPAQGLFVHQRLLYSFMIDAPAEIAEHSRLYWNLHSTFGTGILSVTIAESLYMIHHASTNDDLSPGTPTWFCLVLGFCSMVLHSCIHINLVFHIHPCLLGHSDVRLWHCLQWVTCKISRFY